ncbi:VOC family protein [Streptomyces sp. NPDC060194]|uniref:VOC family protein n=1 Tax=Streptomyces sp. NPDC060194 TaxID=3347069 RepID=UPI003649192B
MSSANDVVPDPGVPCWVNLMVDDLQAAEAFYGAVLGWEFRPGSLGEGFSTAFCKGRPVAGIGSRRPGLAPKPIWTPVFGVADANAAAGSIRERGATVAVGPAALGTGRAALAADREGATFGIWEGPTQVWPHGEDVGVRLDLQAWDLFEAAVFYGGVFGWARGGPTGVEVSFRDDRVVAEHAGHTAATLRGGADPASSALQERPRWLVTFEVEDMERAMGAAASGGGSRSARPAALTGFARTLRDPAGCLFNIAPAA